MEDLEELDSEDGDGPSPGWDAIEEALGEVYGELAPRHFATVIKYALGGPDPIDGISVYPNQDPTPHWHYVTFGFSELHEKESDDPEISGWGFELSFRLADDLRGEPPRWPCGLLQNLARYVFETGSVFGSGHHIDTNGPIAADTDTALRALAFVDDPLLPTITTANGRVDFLQLVGLTRDELDVVRAWNTERFLEFLAERAPLLVTDLGRGSVLDDPELQTQVQEGIARDGSSQGEAFIEDFAWEQSGDELRVVIPPLAVGNLRNLLRGRIGHGRQFQLLGAEQGVLFEPGEPGVRFEEDLPVVSLGPPEALRMAERLEERSGDYRWDELPVVLVVRSFE